MINSPSMLECCVYVIVKHLELYICFTKWPLKEIYRTKHKQVIIGP